MWSPSVGFLSWNFDRAATVKDTSCPSRDCRNRTQVLIAELGINSKMLPENIEPLQPTLKGHVTSDRASWSFKSI